MDGPKDPKELLEIKGIRETQQYLVEEVQKVYRDQGVSIHDKHIELIVRQMLRRVLVAEPGDAPFLPGERVDSQRYAAVNRELVQAGKRAAEGRPELMGITKASLATDSWLSAASFQETTRVLTEAAIEGKSDQLFGLKENIIIGKLIPAGTGHGRATASVEVATPDAERMSFWSSDLEGGDGGEASTDDLASWLRDVGRSAFGGPYGQDDPYAVMPPAGRTPASVRPTTSPPRAIPSPSSGRPRKAPPKLALHCCLERYALLLSGRCARVLRPRHFTKEVQRGSRAHHRPARPQRADNEAVEDEDPRLEGGAATPRRVHARLHDHAQEAELRAPQSRPRPPDQRFGDHRLHPRRGPQPAGALDRARPRGTCEGPPGRPLQDRPRRRSTPPACATAPGPKPLRRQEGVLSCPATAPQLAASSCPIRSTGPCSSPSSCNKVLSRGKRSLAERIVYDALDTVREKTGGDPLQLLKRAFDNARPELEVRSRRVGGATYQVPVEVPPRRATTLSIRWLVGYSRQRRERTMALGSPTRSWMPSNGIGAAVKRKEDLHKMAESNKAFAHYRW